MSLLFTIGDGNRTAEQAPLCHRRKTTTGQAFCRVGAYSHAITCLRSSFPIQQGKVLKYYHLTLSYHSYTRISFSFSPLEAEPQQVSQNFMKLLTVLHRPWSYGQIHPDIPVISILHPSADLMSVGSAAGEVLECSVEPEGRTGSHRVHQVTINEEWGS